MERAVVDVPLGIPATLVGLKQRAVEQKHDVSFTFDQIDNTVALEGSASRVRTAEADLRAVFARMSAASPTIDARAPRTSQPRSAANATPLRTGLSRYVAAKGACTHSWSFVSSSSAPTIDVDVNEFAYELVRYEHQPSVRIEKAPRLQFMQSFNPRFVATMAKVIDSRVGSHDGVKVEANFGRKLFRLIDIEPGCVYSASELQATNRYTAVKTSWSNVCDLRAPAMRELVANLRETAARLGIDEAKEKLSVWLKAGESSVNDRSNVVQAKFVRRDGAWELKQALTYPTPYTVHDVNLANHLSVRVWVCPQGVPADAKWDDVVRAIELRDTDAADSTIFDTLAALALPLHVGSEGQRAEITWTLVKSQLTIPFAGLRFKLATTKSSDVMLEASLPESSRDASMTPGQQFAHLLQRVDAVLEEYAEPRRSAV